MTFSKHHLKRFQACQKRFKADDFFRTSSKTIPGKKKKIPSR